MKDPHWGEVGYLTRSQEAALNELAQAVQQHDLPRSCSIPFLLRFLRARGFNATKAFALLKEDFEWRATFENHVFVASRDFPPALAMHQDGAIRLAGYSKNQRPVIVLQPKFFWPKLVEDPMQLVYFFVFYVDELCRRAEAVGQETFITIADLDGFSMANFSMTHIKIIVSILQNHYPERLGAVYVVKAPFIFTAAWRMIQPLLDERTRSKIEVLTSSEMNRIQNDVDKSQLEEAYGGTAHRYPVPDEIFKLAMIEPVLETANAVATDPSALVVSPQNGKEKSILFPFGNGHTRRRIKHLMKRALFITEQRASSSSMGLDPNKEDLPPPNGLLRQVSRRLWARADDDEAEAKGNDEEERVAAELRDQHEKLLVQMSTLSTLHEIQIIQLQQQIQALAMVLFALILYWVLSL